MPLINDVSLAVGAKAAMLVSEELIAAMVLKSARSAAASLANVSMPIFDGRSEVRLLSMSTDPKMFTARLVARAGLVFVEMQPNFTITLGLHLAGDASREYSQIQMDVSGASFGLRTTIDKLIFDNPEFTVLGSVALSVSRTTALADPKSPSQADVERIEGALAFLLAPRIVAAAFGTCVPVNLPRMFPNFVWSSALSLTTAASYLIILTEDGKLKENTGCPLEQNAPDWDINPGTPVNHNPPDEDLDIGLPIVVTNPPQKPIAEATSGHPLVCLYLPQAVLNEKLAHIYPALTFEDGDNGFIGFNVFCAVIFEGVKVDIDPSRFGIVVTLDVRVHGDAHVTVDVPCVGRKDVAYTTQLNIGTTTAKIFLSPKISNGKLLLKSELEELSLGKVEIYVIFLAAWLSFAGGWGAVAGFILDRIVDEVLKFNLAIKIKQGLENAINSNSFTLIDLQPNRSDLDNQPNVAVFSGSTSAVIMGMAYNPG